MQLVPEAKKWYRSATVWFLSLAGVMQILQLALPQIQGHIPAALYDWLTFACLIVAGVARFIKQPKLQQAVARAEAVPDE